MLFDLGRVAQWESACFTRKRSEVQNLPRPPLCRPSEIVKASSRSRDLGCRREPGFVAAGSKECVQLGTGSTPTVHGIT